MDRTATEHQLCFALAANGQAPEWIQLTPSIGTFSTKDGRGPFAIKDAGAIIRASLAGGTSIRIDYNHAIDLAAKAGLPSPAAGWIEEIAEHGPGNEPGLWGKVKWTPAGAKAIVDGEYRYISPVLLSKKNSDELVAIGGAALTNDPALVMKGLFSVQENDTVNRKALCGALGIAETSTDDQITAAIGKAGADMKQKLAGALGMPETASVEDLCTAAKKIGADAAMAANVQRVLEAAGLRAGSALDEATTVALCTKLKGSAAVAAGGKSVEQLQTQVDELQKQLASLNQHRATTTANAEVEKAITSGKLAPVQKEWAIDYCARDPEGFAKFIGAAPTILKDGRVVEGAPPGDGATLTAGEKHVCALMGIKEDDFVKTRATLRKETTAA